MNARPDLPLDDAAPPVDAAALAAAAAPAGSALFAEITAGLAAGRDLDALLARFLEPIVGLAGAQAGVVRVLDDDAQRLRIVGDVGLPGGVPDAERLVRSDCGACGSAATGDRPVWVADLGGCARVGEGGFPEAGCRRMLVVPLRHRGRVLGVYNLFYDGRARPPRADAVAMLRSVGELLGLALANARLERENLHATVMNERRLMAAEVHDSVAQALAYVKMRLPLLEDALRAHDETRALKYLGDVRETLGEAHTHLRQILTDFRTTVDPKGLMHALGAVAQGFEARTGVALEFVDGVGELALTPERQAQAFNIAQEALANVVRHSFARHARLAVERDGDAVAITVEDDGLGLGDAGGGEPGAHHGIGIMKARAARLGGTLALSARPGGGTVVRLRFALEEPR